MSEGLKSHPHVAAPLSSLQVAMCGQQRDCWVDWMVGLQTEGGQIAKTVKQRGAQSVLASCWSPQGTPLVTSDRAGAISFWEG